MEFDVSIATASATMQPRSPIEFILVAAYAPLVSLKALESNKLNDDTNMSLTQTIQLNSCILTFKNHLQHHVLILRLLQFYIHHLKFNQLSFFESFISFGTEASLLGNVPWPFQKSLPGHKSLWYFPGLDFGKVPSKQSSRSRNLAWTKVEHSVRHWESHLGCTLAFSFLHRVEVWPCGLDLSNLEPNHGSWSKIWAEVYMLFFEGGKIV